MYMLYIYIYIVLWISTRRIICDVDKIKKLLLLYSHYRITFVEHVLVNSAGHYDNKLPPGYGYNMHELCYG